MTEILNNNFNNLNLNNFDDDIRRIEGISGTENQIIENDLNDLELPPKLQRDTTIEIELACERLQSNYNELIEKLGENGSYGSMSGLKERHYYYSHGQTHDNLISKDTMKRIMREVTNILPSQMDVNARGSMFVRYDEVSPQYLRAILTGVEGTPYSSGIFIFDIYIPPEYPNTPCLVKHVTPRSNEIHANNGPGGFSPNLHSDSGQVCLSLLGTWEGPGWDPKTSNVYQVLSSILWMIFGAQHPYYMEPGYGGWEGTAPTNINLCPDRESVIQYDEEVKYYTILLCVLAPLLEPPVGFEKVVTTHLRKKRKLILSTIKKWCANGSTTLQDRLEPLKKELIEAYQNIRTIDDVNDDIQETIETIQFIEKKMIFLKQKIEAAGGEEVAESKVPQAWKRYCLGPQLIEQQQKALQIFEEELKSGKLS